MVIIVGRLISPTFIKPFEWNVFKRVGLLSMFFLVKIVLDMSALVLINIPMYGVLKTATTPLVMFLEFIMRKKVSPMRIQLPVYTTTLGGLIAGWAGFGDFENTALWMTTSLVINMHIPSSNFSAFAPFFLFGGSAGVGDLTFDLLGYLLALLSAMATAAYVVTVGKLGDELKLDSFTLLFYNCLWSLPVAVVLVLVTGEAFQLSKFENLYSYSFIVRHNII